MILFALRVNEMLLWGRALAKTDMFFIFLRRISTVSEATIQSTAMIVMIMANSEAKKAGKVIPDGIRQYRIRLSTYKYNSLSRQLFSLF